jgi:hypothetical protein
MKIALRLSWIVLILAAVSGAQSTTPVPEDAPRQKPEGYAIAGRVVNPVTGAAVGGAVVTVADTRMPMRSVAATTGENGEFAFAGLPAAKFTLMGSRSGYITSMYEQHEQFSTAIVTGPDFATDRLVLRLMPLAMIAGHVNDEVGEGIRNAQVLLFLEDHNGGISRVTQAGEAKTDDRGYFDFGVLQPGTYYLSASAHPFYARNSSAKGNSGGAASPWDVAYPTTYYGGATDSEGASPVVLKGGDRQEVEIQLRPVPALHVTVQVPAETLAEPGQGGMILLPILRKREFDSETFPQGVRSQMIAPGVMEISGVTPGLYEMNLRSSGSRDIEQVIDIDIEHDGQSLTATEATQFGGLKITLKMPEGEPLPKQYVVLLRDAKQKVVEARPGDAQGVVTLGAVRPGKYAIVFETPGKMFAVGRTVATTGSQPGAEVAVTAGANQDVTVELVAGTVRIAGVAQKKGKPVAGVMVVLVPKDATQVQLFRRDQSDFDGTFLLPDVVPGTYTLVAVEDVWGFEWMKPGVLEMYIKTGKGMVVGPGETGVVRVDAVEVVGR